MTYTPNVTIPVNAKAGDIIEIKTLIPHKMLPASPGATKDQPDTPAKFIESFIAEFNGEKVFSATLTPEVSANPYISFFMKVTKSGTFTFKWVENNDRTIKTVQHELKLA